MRVESNLARIEARLDNIATKEDFARIEARLDNTMTKSDLDEKIFQLLMFHTLITIAVVGTVLAVGAYLFRLVI